MTHQPHPTSTDVARLYLLEKTHIEIRSALGLTRAQLLHVLADLFAEGMPKRQGHVMTQAQVHAIHRKYLAGAGSIDDLAEAIGFTGGTARRRMRRMKLCLSEGSTAEPIGAARSPAQAEQREITALVVARIEDLRVARGWSIERLASASNLSFWTVIGLRRHLVDPRLSTVLSLCKGLGVTSNDLLGDLPLPVEHCGSRKRSPAAPTRGPR